MDDPVDVFVQTRVLPVLRPVVQMLRELMRQEAPGVAETISYGIPAFRGRRILAVISPTKKEITFAFSRGVELEDKYGLLRGVGKVSKHIKIRRLDDVDKDVLRYYVRQVVALDTNAP